MTTRIARLAETLAKPIFRGLSDAEAAAALMARTERGPIAAESVIRLLLLLDRWPQIVAASRVLNEEPRTIAALRMTEALARLPTFDLAVPAYSAAIEGGLDGLIAAGLLSSDDKTAVLGLADGLRSAADAEGLGEVSEADVKEARND